jgi:hypothetical protein
VKKRHLALILATGMAVAATSASATSTKNFRPGDVRACSPHACVVIRSQPVLDALARFYYGAGAAVEAAAPPSRSPYLRLVYTDGYVTGVVAGSRFTRFLSFGVNLDQFTARTWYAVPAPVASALRRLAPKLSPRPLPTNILSLSH